MAATVTLGGVTIPGNLMDGELSYSRQIRWSEAKPLGYVGNINTNIGSDPIEHRYHARVTSAQRSSVQALADAGAVVAFSYSNGDISISQNVLIKRFKASKNNNVGGLLTKWDVDMILEEQP